MKKSVNRLLPLLIVVASCNSQTSNEHTQSDSLKPEPVVAGLQPAQDGCYRNVSGNGQRDTIYAQLHFAGDSITGSYSVALFEKDARRGTVSGRVAPDSTIKLVYRFMQEGVADSTGLEFKRSGNALLQRPSRYDASTGREVPDEKAGFTIRLEGVECAR